MKIVLANNLFEPYNRGGAEKVMKEMADNFLNAGHEVIIISTIPKDKNEFKSLTNSNYQIYQIPSSYYNLANYSKLRKLLWHLNNFCNPKKRITYHKILKKEKPDLIITHNLVGLGFFLASIAQGLNIKHEHFLHDIQLLHPSGLMMLNKEDNINKLPAKIYQRLTRSYFKKTNKIISPSNWLLREHITRGFFPGKETEIRRLKTSILTEANKIMNNEKTIESQNTNHFLFVAQLEEHKGLNFLLEVFSKFENKLATLTIIGRGKEIDLVKKYASSDKRLNYLGYLENLEIKQEMEKADFLIIPSLCYENSPTVIYEANAVNLKIIAANIGGIPEIIKTNDILFTAGNKTDLLEKLISVAG